MSEENKLEGEDLDRAVAHALGRETASRSSGLHVRFLEIAPDAWSFWSPSTMWAQGGPIIEREHIRLTVDDAGGWWAERRMFSDGRKAFHTSFDKAVIGRGPTPLIAAMLCFVESKRPRNEQ